MHNNCLLFVEIRIKPPRRHIRNKINEDEICNLEELYDRPLDGQPLHDQPLNGQPVHDQPLDGQPLDNQPLDDQPLDDQPLDDDALNIKMDTMTLMADSSSLKASNILVPLTNDDRIISDKSPLKTNYSTATTTNIFLSSDNVLMSDLSMEENHPHDDDFEDRLTKLRRDHEERMKEYDDKIQHFEKKINKVCKQIKKMGRDMKNVMIEKEEKQQEFLNLLNEHARLSKTDK
ncbi:unnamed protein product [Rotaria sordida]|uniref:Uncharacterized protein n=1 Tax=Rotaria sordida TaxID=392033 RepID=A0A815AJU6_9BILA|nr:unnamed protein product [Rotaria sordida]